MRAPDYEPTLVLLRGPRGQRQPEQLRKVRLVLRRQLLHQGRVRFDGRLELFVRH